jgi:hypothetical protein
MGFGFYEFVMTPSQQRLTLQVEVRSDRLNFWHKRNPVTFQTFLAARRVPIENMLADKQYKCDP